MVSPRSLADLSVFTALALTGTAPALAQSSAPLPPIVEVPGVGLVYFEPVPASDTQSQQRTVNIPGYGNVLIIPVRPADTRPSKQACIDEQIKREGGSPSPLARRVIDLKCSQR